MSSQPLNIAIIGAGLAGLAAAGFLRRNHNVLIFEKYSKEAIFQTEDHDYGMSIVTNAYNLLLRHGIDEEALKPVYIKNLIRRDLTTNEETQSRAFETGGSPNIFTRRSQLHRELARLATDPSLPGTPAKIYTGVEFVHTDVLRGVVIVRPHDQTVSTEYEVDLIIGADGINSVVRGQVLAAADPNTPSLIIPTGRVAYLSQVPASFIESDPDLSFQLASASPSDSAAPKIAAGLTTWIGPEGMSKHILSFPTDNGQTFHVVAYAPEGDWTSQFEQNKRSIITGVGKDRVIKDFEQFHPAVKKLLGYNETHEVWRIRDVEPLDIWTAGKTVLIGDAAHAIAPHAGQGCNIAIEDGEALAYLLQDATPADIPARIVTFIQLRKERAHLVQRTSRLMGGVHQDKAKQDVESGKYKPINLDLFRREIYGYRGAEQALKARESPAPSNPGPPTASA